MQSDWREESPCSHSSDHPHSPVASRAKRRCPRPRARRLRGRRGFGTSLKQLRHLPPQAARSYISSKRACTKSKRQNRKLPQLRPGQAHRFLCSRGFRVDPLSEIRPHHDACAAASPDDGRGVLVSRRPARQARGGRMPSAFDRRATPRAGMHGRPNATVIAKRST